MEEAVERLQPSLDADDRVISDAVIAAIGTDPALAAQFVTNFNSIVAVVPALAPAAALLALVVVVLEVLFFVLVGLVIGILLYLLVDYVADQLEEESTIVDFDPGTAFSREIFVELPKDDDGRPAPFDIPRPPKIDISTRTDECPLTREEYYAGLTTIPNSLSGDDGNYQTQVAGNTEYRIVGVTTAARFAIDADGLEIPIDRALEAKFVANPDSTFFSLDLPGAIQGEIYFQFFRYGEIIRDPCVPIASLQVRVSDEVAVPFFADALARFDVPGDVVVIEAEDG